MRIEKRSSDNVRLKIWNGIIIFTTLIFSAALFVFSLRFISHDFLEKQIISFANKQNLPLTSLNITQFDANNFSASAIEFAGEPSPKIENLQLDFSLPSLLSGRLNSLSADAINLALKRGANGVYISGMQDFQAFAPQSPSSQNSKNLFETFQNFYARLPQKIDISNLKFSFSDKNLSIFLPLDFKFSLLPNSATEIKSGAWNLKFLDYQLQSETMQFAAQMDDENIFRGKLLLQNIKINGLISPFPDVSAQMEFSLAPQNFKSTISISDLKNLVSLQMHFDLPNENFSAGKFSLQNLHFPFAGGVISHADFSTDLASPIHLNLQLRNIQLDEILAKLSDGKIKASGRVSGNLPFTYLPDGSISLKKGELESSSSGFIAISPAIFPPDNAQLKMLGEILQNFHYTKLKIFVISARDFRLQLEGNNQAALNAKPIKLNVNLTGDMLPLLQKGALVFSDVQKFLLQESQ